MHSCVNKVFFVQKKCECYWPVDEEKPLRLNSGIVVFLNSIVALPDYTIRRMKVVNVSLSPILIALYRNLQIIF